MVLSAQRKNMLMKLMHHSKAYAPSSPAVLAGAMLGGRQKSVLLPLSAFALAALVELAAPPPEHRGWWRRE